MILIIGAATLRPEYREQGLELGKAHSARSRTEPGCLSHDCHIDAVNSNRIVFIERWTDMDAVRRHFAVPESIRFVRDLQALSGAVPEIALYESSALAAPTL